MAIYIRERGWKALFAACICISVIVLVGLCVVLGLPQNLPLFVRHFESKPQKSLPLLRSRPLGTIIKMPTPEKIPPVKAPQPVRIRTEQSKNWRPEKPPEPAVQQLSNNWFAQRSSQSAHFRVRRLDVLGDSADGEAGIATAIDSDGGLWLGAWIYPSSNGAFDARFAIRAGINVGWQYGSMNSKGDGGYAVRIVRTSKDHNDSLIELWDGNVCVQRRVMPFQCEKTVHLTIGFGGNGTVAGRVVDAKDRHYQFVFDQHRADSRGPYVAMSSISTGTNALVFRQVCYETMGPIDDVSSVQDVRQKSIKFLNANR